MIVIVEAIVPTIDIGTKATLLSDKLIKDDRVQNKDVNTGTTLGIADTKIFYGIEVKDILDSFPIAYSILSQAWSSISELNLRLMRVTFNYPVDWTLTQEELSNETNR